MIRSLTAMTTLLLLTASLTAARCDSGRAGRHRSRRMDHRRGATAGPAMTARRLQINLRSSDGNNSWGFGVPIAELAGLPAAAQSGVASDVRFTLTREAGIFRFQGSFDQGTRRRARYTFTADPAFVSGMASPRLSQSVERQSRAARRDRRHAGLRPQARRGRDTRRWLSTISCGCGFTA